MKGILSLYQYAEKQNIEVLSFPLPETSSMSIMTDSGDCYIGIDDSKKDGESLERVHFAHELGHCMTGAFYNRYSTADLRQRHENKANKWAIRKLIPAKNLDAAIADGHTEFWDLAEYFGVTEDFIRKTVCLYTHGNLATDLYF